MVLTLERAKTWIVGWTDNGWHRVPKTRTTDVAAAEALFSRPLSGMAKLRQLKSYFPLLLLSSFRSQTDWGVERFVWMEEVLSEQHAEARLQLGFHSRRVHGRQECTAYAQRHRQSSEMIFATGAWKLMRIAGHCLKGTSFASTFRVLAVWYQPLAIMAGHYQFFLRFGFWQ